MIFRQLTDPESWTYTYLFGFPETGEALLLDPVCEMIDRDLSVIQELGLTLSYTLETHVHADHITSACRLRSLTGCKVVYPAMDNLLDEAGMGQIFTGDALLIDGCGRTDFQSGDAATLYRSVHDKLFTLPDETLVYPAHDYQHRHVSSIGQEKERNARLGDNRSMDEFIEIMDNLNLPYPKRIDVAVPANLLCGDCTEDVLVNEPEGPSMQG